MKGHCLKSESSIKNLRVQIKILSFEVLLVIVFYTYTAIQETQNVLYFPIKINLATTL